MMSIKMRENKNFTVMLVHTYMKVCIYQKLNTIGKKYQTDVLVTMGNLSPNPFTEFD